MSYGYFSKYDREVVRVFQIREHHAKIVKLGRYGIMPFEVFRLKIVSIESFFKTIKDVDLCFTSNANTQLHQMMCREKEL